jgi:predicted nucleic acid-binding protein
MKKIYLDTNAFYFFFFEHKEYTAGIKKIFKKIQKREYTGVTNCLTLDELAYVILMRLIEKKYKRHPMEVIKERKAVILEFLKEIESVFDVVFSFDNLVIANADKNMLSLIPSVMGQTLLLPRDCVHFRTMIDHGCTAILSTDEDFDEIEGIQRIKL